MEDSVRSQMISLLNSQLRLRKRIHMGRLQTLNDALIKILLGKNPEISVWFLCFFPLWQCLCQRSVWERTTKAAENALRSSSPSPSRTAALWAGAETACFAYYASQHAWQGHVASGGEGGPLPSLNMCSKADSESAWKDSFKLPREIDCEPLHC